MFADVAVCEKATLPDNEPWGGVGRSGGWRGSIRPGRRRSGTTRPDTPLAVRSIAGSCGFGWLAILAPKMVESKLTDKRR